MDKFTTTLRLNLSKPDHKMAYNVLTSSDVSHTKLIVAALNAFSENEIHRKMLLADITEIVRNEICSALHNGTNVNFTATAENAKTEKTDTVHTIVNAESENTAVIKNDENEDMSANIDWNFL